MRTFDDEAAESGTRQLLFDSLLPSTGPALAMGAQSLENVGKIMIAIDSEDEATIPQDTMALTPTVKWDPNTG